MFPPFAVALAAASLILTGCVSADATKTTSSIGSLTSGYAPDASSMQLVGHAFAPPAFYTFCKQERRLCSTTGAARSVKLTPERMKQLNSVNLSVNRRIREQHDIVSTGKDDVWNVPVNVGDCEDFAILKKHELMKLGWPASALLLTVATHMGEGHVVLTVRTDQGDMVLDNRTSRIRDWSRTPYRYFARQSQTSHGKWDRIGSAGGRTS